MDIENFKIFLENDKNITSDGSIKKRISMAKRAEKILSTDFDDIVQSNSAMLTALTTLKQHEPNEHNLLQNALRKYYTFRTGNKFPKMLDLGGAE